MRTTLDLPDPLFREVKTRAVQQGVTLKDLLARYIQAGMNAPAAIEPARATPQAYPIPIAIRRKEGAPLTPALTNAELNAILDAEDLANHLRVTLQ
ncbi:MAG: hypothetical protein ABI600_12655 [Luteolibacter sp.]